MRILTVKTIQHLAGLAATLLFFSPFTIVGFAGGNDVDRLIQDLKSTDTAVRRDAVKALGKLSDTRAIEPLISVLSDQDTWIKDDAVEALARIGSPAVEPLIEALGRTDVDYKLYAAKALGEIGDARAIESLISVSRDKDPFVPIYAADALANIGTPAIAPLLAAINDSSSHKRLCAARALGKIGDIRAVQPLIRALKDKVWRVRHHATVSLGDLGDSRAVQPLLTALDVETNYTVQSNILTAIRSIGDTSAVEPLLGMLRRKGKNWDRRWEILTTLGALRDNRAVEAMINVLQDEQERTRARESAADALGAMKDIRAVGILVGLLGQEGLTGSAIWNLGRIGDPNAVEPLIDFMRESQGRSLWQKWTAEALAQIGIPAVQPLLTILNDQEFGVRHNAAKALGEISDQRATHALENAMETKDLVLVSGAYAFFIRRGLPGTETVLIEALSKHGDKSMARDFMLSGNDQLAEAGSNWNAEHGIRLPAIWMGEHEGPRWGEAASKESQ